MAEAYLILSYLGAVACLYEQVIVLIGEEGIKSGHWIWPLLLQVAPTQDNPPFYIGYYTDRSIRLRAQIQCIVSVVSVRHHRLPYTDQGIHLSSIHSYSVDQVYSYLTSSYALTSSVWLSPVDSILHSWHARLEQYQVESPVIRIQVHRVSRQIGWCLGSLTLAIILDSLLTLTP